LNISPSHVCGRVRDVDEGVWISVRETKSGIVRALKIGMSAVGD
jgi:hypothetical protein